MKDFEYLKAGTLDEAISLLAKHKGEAKVFSGGTDLLVEMKQKVITPRYLVDIKPLSDLDFIHYDEREGLKIGALTTMHTLETALVIKDKFTILAQAAHEIGSAQVRNRATIGGNLCHAAPSADTAPALIGLGARVKIRGSVGDRSIPLEEFFKGPGETVLQVDEILTEIQIPNCLPHTAGVYMKLGRIKAMDLALVGVAVVVTPRNGVCSDIKIVLGAVAPTPIRAKEAEGMLRGKKIRDDVIEQAAQTASKEARPISDVRASAEYRREIVKVLTMRAFKQAWELAGSV